jgi:hypothetical protein
MTDESRDEIRIDGMNENDAQDRLLHAALRNFRQCVHAWSEAEYGQPRVVLLQDARRTTRPWAIASCALGVALVASLAGTGVHERNRHMEQARLAAQKQAEQQRAMAAERAKQSEDLMANVDRDVSQEVPSALEPLAQLMTDDGAQ